MNPLTRLHSSPTSARGQYGSEEQPGSGPTYATGRVSRPALQLRRGLPLSRRAFRETSPMSPSEQEPRSQLDLT